MCTLIWNWVQFLEAPWFQRPVEVLQEWISIASLVQKASEMHPGYRRSYLLIDFLPMRGEI